ncbi:MAG: hypothetical protein M1812_007807 [Candelaria pacifica]|nr:MAG: hypothetical protein M1812_007807 [Candelaria pacifica]
MSPSVVSKPAPQPPHDQFEGLDLGILGVGVAYPPYEVGPDALETIAKRYYPESKALKKVLGINHYTGISTRSTFGDVDHPLVNQTNAPNISELCDLFLTEGVALSVQACKKAIEEWGGTADDITHVVATTCTNSANPGFDHYVVKELGVRHSVEKVLLHGVGCSGGLAALRTAANLALGASFQKRPARILVMACEISSVLVRSELDSIIEEEEIRIGPVLFSDCASALVLSNGVQEEASENEPVYELLGWKHDMLHNTEDDLGFSVHPLGWKVILSARVPKLAAAAVPAVFSDLLKSLPNLKDTSPTAYDWALHPGGSLILSGVEESMNITNSQTRASWHIYKHHGNSSSATIFSVMDQLRKMGEGKEFVVGCAFGPGIAVEMCMLKRRMADLRTPDSGEAALMSEALD